MAEGPERRPDDEPTSHRTILRSSAIVGGSTVATIAFGIFRTKVAALLLGPAGVGIIGIFQTLVQTGGNLAALGLGTAGTREIAAAHDEPARLALARAALLRGSVLLAVVGALVTVLLQVPLARWLLGDAAKAPSIAWLGVGVGLTVISVVQIAYLVGRRQIGMVARTNIFSAAIGSIVAIAALWLGGADAIVPYVLAPLAATVAAGWWFVRKASADIARAGASGSKLPTFAAMLGSGIPFVVAGVAALAAQLAARAMIQRSLGVDAVGQFQAAYFISVIYVGFVLQAMGADYFPRLTAAIGDRDHANRLVREQSEVALLIAAPVLLGTLGAAAWIVPLLYSSAFGEAAQILGWQVFGDLFKVVSWPLGYVLLAKGASRTYMLCELGASAVLLLALAVLLPVMGVEASGVAVLVSYAFYLPLVMVIARRLTGFAWNGAILRLFVGLVLAGAALMVVGRASPVIGLVAGTACAGVAAWYALKALEHALPPIVGRTLARLRGQRSEG